MGQAVVPTPILIAGMHRSGTSFLAGSLEASGLHLGDVATQNKHNAKGNRELKALNAFHDKVLARHGCAWDHPPDVALDFSRDEAEELLALLADFDAPFGIKDPRLVLFWPGYRRVFPNAVWVGIFRHPLPVAASLKARNGFGRRKSLRLWSTYNRFLMEAYTQKPFPILNFDAPAPELVQAVDDLALRLGLESGRGSSFFAGELRHGKKPLLRSLLYPRIMSVYRQLVKWSSFSP